MLTGEDFVKITDFGTAQIMQYGAAQQTSATGTPAYMSPEQIKGKAVDGRTDIFSLGVMLYELTTGQKPFRGQDIATILHQILNQEPVPPQQLNPNIPAGVGSTIMKALSKSPFLRYENCRELMDDLKNYRPGESPAKENATASMSTMAPRPAIREKLDKSYHAEMPRIPGIEPRSTVPIPARSKPIPPPTAPAADVLRETGQPGEGIYGGPTTKPDLAAAFKRVAKIGALILLAAMLGSWAIKMIMRTQQPESDMTPASQENATSNQPQPMEADSAQRPLYVSDSNPKVAVVNELAQPWSSKRFFFRSLTLSRYVPALIVRLPGAASESKSYWAFSLQAPFVQCKFEYIENVAKLSSEYGFAARHPMVVNPCSHAIHDPLQLKELPGNILVRGAIVQGNDLRPPYGIEVRVSGNQIYAVSME
jgi:serine/threonine protein kinase